MRRAILSVLVHAVGIAALWFGDGFSRGELPVVAAAGKIWETPVLVVPAPPRAVVAARVLRSRQATTPANATAVAVPDELPVPEDLLADARIGPAGAGEACSGAGCGGVDDVGVGTIGVDIAGMAAVPDPPPLIRVGGDVRAPVKLRQVDPVYPAIARAARVQGTVVVECVIDPHGNVTDARVVSGPQLLQRAAVEAVQQWRYTPTLLSGVPVAVLMSVTVKFTLTDVARESEAVVGVPRFGRQAAARRGPRIAHVMPPRAAAARAPRAVGRTTRVVARRHIVEAGVVPVGAPFVHRGAQVEEAEAIRAVEADQPWTVKRSRRNVWRCPTPVVARRELPLRLGRQTAAEPRRARLRVEPADADHRLLRVVEAGFAPPRRRRGEPGREKPRVLFVRHRGGAERESGDSHLVHRRFVGPAGVVAHHERAARDADYSWPERSISPVAR